MDDSDSTFDGSSADDSMAQDALVGSSADESTDVSVGAGMGDAGAGDAGAQWHAHCETHFNSDGSSFPWDGLTRSSQAAAWDDAIHHDNVEHQGDRTATVAQGPQP